MPEIKFINEEILDLDSQEEFFFIVTLASELGVVIKRELVTKDFERALCLAQRLADTAKIGWTVAIQSLLVKSVTEFSVQPHSIVAEEEIELDSPF